MCEGYEWWAWQHEAEQRAKKEKADELKKQSKAASPPQSAEPETQQPVPA